MIAYLILLLAVVSRVVPHPYSVTMVGGSLLYFGARRSSWQVAIAVAALAVTDFCLTHFMYGYSFALVSYLPTWAWYAGACFIGKGLLGRETTMLRGVGAVVGSASAFFLVSNFAVWMTSTMYPHSLAGLGACYAMGVPYYGNDLVSTAAVVSVLFGVPVLVKSFADGESLATRA
jgi:Sec-independent protein secretion pathway component TatC